MAARKQRARRGRSAPWGRHLIGVTIGFTVGGIIGALLAAPLVAVGAAILAYLRERADADRAPAEALQAAG